MVLTSYICDQCGEPFMRHPRPAKRKFCGKECKDKGAFVHGLNANGYRIVSNGRERVYEHRLVMEQHIGRKLHAWEHVHHVNYDKADNRIENLTILEASAHHRTHVTPTFDVDAARALYETGVGYRKLSMQFGVARQNIMGLFIRRGWHIVGRTRTTLKAQYGR